jgi:hypothetical protein
MSITKYYFRNFFAAARKRKSRLKTEIYNFPTELKSGNAAKTRWFSYWTVPKQKRER